MGPSLSYNQAPGELCDVGICLLEKGLRPGRLTFVLGNRDGVPLHLVGLFVCVLVVLVEVVLNILDRIQGVCLVLCTTSQQAQRKGLMPKINVCYPFDLCYSKCWFSTDRIKQRSRV